MSEAKHTPGPWHVPGNAPWQILDSRSMPGDEALAVTHDDERRGRTKEQSEANTRLIAAAPELLASLKTLVTQIEDWERAVESIVGKRQYPWSDLEEAKDLIAKAEGRS